jgi:hypothetical protein
MCQSAPHSAGMGFIEGVQSRKEPLAIAAKRVAFCCTYVSDGQVPQVSINRGRQCRRRNVQLAQILPPEPIDVPFEIRYSP